MSAANFGVYNTQIHTGRDEDATQIATIYCLIDPRVSGLASIRYVGKTERPLHSRLASHLSSVRMGKKTYRDNWIRQLLLVGVRPVISMLEITNRVGADDRERLWIAHLRSLGCPLTNLTDGGEGTSGYKASSETRAKLSAASMGNKNSLGHRHSEETRAKLGEAQKGNKKSLGCRRTEDAKAKTAAGLMGNKNALGCHRSDETRNKMSASIKKYFADHPEVGTKISAAKMGNKNGLGNKSFLGRHHSEGTRSKISVALKRLWAAKRMATKCL